MNAYADLLRGLAEKSKREEQQALSSSLLLRLAQVYWEDLNERSEAKQLLEKAHQMNPGQSEIMKGLAELYREEHADEKEKKMLSELTMGEHPVALRASAHYRLAELSGLSNELEPLLNHLEQATMMLMQKDTVERLFDMALKLDFKRSQRRLESIAKIAAEPQLLLLIQEVKAQADDAPFSVIQDAIRSSLLLNDHNRSAKLLALAQNRLDTPEQEYWLCMHRAQFEQKDGRTRDAIQTLSSGITFAKDALTEEHEVHLKRELARVLLEGAVALAAGGAETHASDSTEGMKQHALDTYVELVEQRESETKDWEGLFEAVARFKAGDFLQGKMSRWISDSLDPVIRNNTRKQWVNFLEKQGWDLELQAQILNDMIEDDIDDVIAADRLRLIYEQTGQTEALVMVLERQFDRALALGDEGRVVQSALALGTWVEQQSFEQAFDIYGRALEVVPNHPGLADAALRLQRYKADLKERAQLLEKHMPNVESNASTEGNTGGESNRTKEMALELAAVYEELGDQEGTQRALEAAFAQDQTDAVLLKRLEDNYRETQAHDALATLMMNDAKLIKDPKASAQRFLEAATVFQDKLGDRDKALQALQIAMQKDPTSLEAIRNQMHLLADAGDKNAAADSVDAALKAIKSDKDKALAHAWVAELYLDEPQIAAARMQVAYGLDPETYANPLLDSLLKLWDASKGQPGEALQVIRLYDFYLEQGNQAEADALLEQYMDIELSDLNLQKKLLAYEQSKGMHEAVAIRAERMAKAYPEDETLLMFAVDANLATGSHPVAELLLKEEYQRDKSNEKIRQKLATLFENTGNKDALVGFWVDEADATSDKEKQFELYKKSGEMCLELGDSGRAFTLIQNAAMIKPEDGAIAVLYADTLMAAGLFDDAIAFLEEAIQHPKRKKSPELALLQWRMATIAGASNDPSTQLAWLSAALDTDKNNQYIASEMARVAMANGDDDSALKALKLVTLQKQPADMSKAEAFYRQAQISVKQGDTQKAVMWARRAKMENAQYTEAENLLKSLGEKV